MRDSVICLLVSDLLGIVIEYVLVPLVTEFLYCRNHQPEIVVEDILPIFVRLDQLFVNLKSFQFQIKLLINGFILSMIDMAFLVNYFKYLPDLITRVGSYWVEGFPVEVF